MAIACHRLIGAAHLTLLQIADKAHAVRAMARHPLPAISRACVTRASTPLFTALGTALPFLPH